MSSSNCCFLTCIQVSQESGQVVWYAHFFQNFPQLILIHTVKGFGIVSKAEIDFSGTLLLFQWSKGLYLQTLTGRPLVAISGYEETKVKLHIRVELNYTLCTAFLKDKIGTFTFCYSLKFKILYSGRGSFLNGFKENFYTKVLNSKLLLIFLKLRVVSQDVKLSLHELDELYVIFKVLFFFFKWKIIFLAEFYHNHPTILSLIMLVDRF